MRKCPVEETKLVGQKRSTVRPNKKTLRFQHHHIPANSH
jgi:hypothetical protein